MERQVVITRYYYYDTKGETESECFDDALNQYYEEVGAPVPSFYYDNIDFVEDFD